MSSNELPPGATEAPEQDEHQPRTYTRRELRNRRILFWGGIIVWVLILCIPFLFVVLAIRGEFSVPLPGNIPENQARVWMVMEPQERGIAYSAPRVFERDPLALSVQTNVRYLLWEGENEALSYCTRYTRESEGEDWQYAQSIEGACE